MGLVLAGCTSTFDAGENRPHGVLPVDERNPIVIINDGVYDNWQGEYAMLLANGGGPKLAGIVVVTTKQRPTIEDNVAGWRALVAAARSSGLSVPDPITSIGAPLKRPTTSDIGATEPNRSEGALFLLDAAKRLSQPYRPLVVVTGSRLTDVADAYLVDPSIVDRVVVVSSLGALSSSGADMAAPNGEMDPWADTIVAAKFTYIQVSAFYDSTTDVPPSSATALLNNAFSYWVTDKVSQVWSLPAAADQVAVAAVGIPSFAVIADRVSPAGLVAEGATAGPALAKIANGRDWLVSQIDSSKATARFWELLTDPHTYAH